MDLHKIWLKRYEKHLFSLLHLIGTEVGVVQNVGMINYKKVVRDLYCARRGADLWEWKNEFVLNLQGKNGQSDANNKGLDCLFRGPGFASAENRGIEQWAKEKEVLQQHLIFPCCVLSSILVTCLTAYCQYFLFSFWEIIFRLSENIIFRLSETLKPSTPFHNCLSVLVVSFFRSSFVLEAEKVSIVHVHWQCMNMRMCVEFKGFRF